jgi:GNAT superfamily N-acetyltransferase
VITYRHADPGDLSAVADLLYEVETFYGSTDLPPREPWERQIASLLFSSAPAARVLLAVDTDGPQAFASYSFLWPAAGVTKSVYLKELYVRETRRGCGIGAGLMAQLSSIAQQTGSSRLEWATDTDNPDAQAFYDKIGASRASGKIMYRVEGSDLIKLSGLPTA